ncbi:GNAT family N-acetyltransferase [Piscinibacter sp. XHJ-5]|uniref:GNAT family N-acetyltransferase n=1 Tax=Piscinibacter sp. XHJ-5 TaxID=3037797 RepID=UPI002452BD31|nr:GNAT family N-acetyltransferase [Piscinibacter sp. XHJ-5]
MTDELRIPPPAGETAFPATAVNWAWVPVRSLSARHRPRIVAHLLSLNEHDRYLRFGHPASDEQIARYVDTLDFDRDEMFGIFNRRLEIIAMAHLAYTPPSAPANPRSMAEFGVSVRHKARGRGYGGRLFEHAAMHARNRRVDTLFIHALSENTAMLKIARKAGALVERSGSESEAWVKLPGESFATRFGEMLETQAAEIDYRLKVHAHRVSEILESLAEVKTHLNRKAPAASE